jgi:hypothetical protein
LKGFSMTEAVVAPASATPSAAGTVPDSFINPDGSFKDGWREGLVPQEFQTSGVYSKVGDVKGAMRQLGYLDKLVGSKGVIVPGEGSPQTVIEEFRAAIGVPKTSDDYLKSYKAPEDIAMIDMSPEAMKPVFAKLHEAGYTQKQAEVGVAIYQEAIRNLEKSIMEQKSQNEAEAERLISERTGAAKKERVHLANVAIDKITQGWNPEDKARLFDPEKGLLNSPDHAQLRPYLLDFLADAGSKMVEGKIISEHEQAGGQLTPAQAKDAIAELESTPGFMIPDQQGNLMKDDGRRELYNSLAQKRTALYHMMTAGR